MCSEKQPHEKLTARPDDAPAEKGASRADEQLPLELVAVEAALAALSPHANALDRDELMFRAGQLSPLKEDDHRATPRRSWRWPAGFASMTAVAAALLVMLLIRPEPTVIVRDRIVKVPVAPSDAEGGRYAVEATDATTDSGPSQPRAVSPGPTLESSHDNSQLAITLPGWLQPDWEKSQRRSPWASIRDEVLAKGLDAWEDPPPRASHKNEPPQAPSSRRQWFDMLLDDQA